MWFRNAGNTTKYHLAVVDYIRTGKAVCGADISRPAYVIDVRPMTQVCEHCVKKVDA